MSRGDCQYEATGNTEGERQELRCAVCGHTRWGDPAQRYRRRCVARFIQERPEQGGPGTELVLLLQSLGIDAKFCTTGCKSRSRAMDALGVEGCRANRDEIAGWLRDAAGEASLWAKAKAAAAALASGLALRIDWLDPFPSLVDEAIRRAEERPREVEPRNYEDLPQGTQRNAEGRSEQSLLLRFAHGFGDAVQFTVVLRHLQALRPDLAVDVECHPEMVGLFAGLCRRAFAHGAASQGQGQGTYGLYHFVAWWEPTAIYPDSPSTKAEKYMREALAITPRPELCSYLVNLQAGQALESFSSAPGLSRGFALLHCAGATAKRHKDLPPAARAAAIAAVQARGLVPIVLDWEGGGETDTEREALRLVAHGLRTALRTEYPSTPAPRADGAALVALAARAALCVGIDSGPGHAFAASGAPTILIWTRHHPLNFCGTNQNVLHLVPRDHPRYARGDYEIGRAFFERHYNHRVYDDLESAIAEAVQDGLDGGSPLPDPALPL